jgi:hypothetical protein
MTDHGYWTFFMLMVVLKEFTLEQANAAIADAPATAWYDGMMVYL